MKNNGVIYQPPRSNDHFLYIDIKNKIVKKIFFSGLTKDSRYCGSVIHPNGYAYFLPERSQKVIRLNLETEEMDYIGDTVSPMCFDAKIAIDKNIYGFSAYGKGILKIDVKNNTVNMIHVDEEFRSYGTKLGINGKIYSIPGTGDKVWEYDPINDKLNAIYTINTGVKAKYAGGASDKMGIIWGIPVDSGKILEIKPDTIIEIPEIIRKSFFDDFY